MRRYLRYTLLLTGLSFCPGLVAQDTMNLLDSDCSPALDERYNCA